MTHLLAHHLSRNLLRPHLEQGALMKTNKKPLRAADALTTQEAIRKNVGVALGQLRSGPQTPVEEAFTLAWYARKLDRGKT